jgi:hypothetical protein
MAELFKIDMRLFEDFNFRLRALQQHFGSSAPRSSKNPLVQRIIMEGRLQAFSMCHSSFRDLLYSMFEGSPLKKADSTPENALGEILTWMYQQKMLTLEEAQDFIEQFDTAMLLSYDKEWLDTQEKRNLFDERCTKLSRYYYRMSRFSGMLSQRLVVTKEAGHERA